LPVIRILRCLPGVNQGSSAVPRLSIIIPVLGSSTRLESTLVSVLENRPPDCEILVVFNAPYDDPYDLAGEIRFLQVPQGLGLIGGLNEGIEASNSPVVHLLSAGLKATEGWTEAALAHFTDQRVASVAPLVVDVVDGCTPIACGLDYCCRRGRVIRKCVGGVSESQPVNCEEPTEVLGPLIHAAFYRRSALELVGGLPRGMGEGFADIDLAMSLRFAGYRGVIEPRSVACCTAADIAPPKASFGQGLAAERLFWRAAPIAGWLNSLARHPWGVLADFVGALPRGGALSSLAGRFLGVCQMGSHRAHHQWLMDVQRAASALFRGTRSMRLRIDGPHEFSPAAEPAQPLMVVHPTV
jgi:hypothetical protein